MSLCLKRFPVKHHASTQGEQRWTVITDQARMEQVGERYSMNQSNGGSHVERVSWYRECW